MKKLLKQIAEMEEVTKRMRSAQRLLEREIALNPKIVKAEHKAEGERIRERFFRRVLNSKLRRGQA